MRRKGISEIFSTVLILVLTLVVLSSFLILILNQSSQTLSEALPRGKCVMRVVEVVETASTAYIFVYNHGDSPCRVVRIYATDEYGNVLGVVYEVESSKNLCHLSCSDIPRYASVVRGVGDVCIWPNNVTGYEVDLSGLSGVAGFRIVDACGYWVEWP